MAARFGRPETDELG